MNFRYFVVLAGMRTGSNYLEETLNACDGVTCYGEVFNPAFVGHAKTDELFGRTVAQVAADPVAMIGLLCERTDGLAGFRLFADQNHAALDHVLADPACAKIVLTRNPAESFVSLEIARKTDQWRLSDAKNRRSAQILFDPAAFRAYLSERRDFYSAVRHRIRATGQGSFEIDYSELDDLDLAAGMRRFLGRGDARVGRAKKTRKQNPEPLSDKVSNFPEMVAELAKLDPMDLFADPGFEPARGAHYGTYVAGPKSPLLYMPVKSGPVGAVTAWLAALDQVAPEALASGFSQKDLRQWKRQHKAHRSFTVIRHPVRRAFTAFRRHIVEPGPDHFSAIRAALESQYGLDLPPIGPAGEVPDASLKQGFSAFLSFLKSNLAGQTAIRVDPAWASQNAIVSGMAEFALPDHIFREDDLERDLRWLCAGMALTAPDYVPDIEEMAVLTMIYDADIEQAARAAYQRDYMVFGFSRWGG